MNVEDVRRLIAYNTWANRRLLDTARTVAVADFTRDLGASYGSIRGTLLHIMAGEWKGLQFWCGKPYEAVFPQDDYPTIAALDTRWADITADQQRFVAGLTDERLRVTSIVRGTERPLADTLQHLLTHSAYHRGQVVTLLRQTGHVPPSTDFLVYLGEAG